MSLELISNLCEIIRIQNEIIEKQNEVLEQAKICEAAAAELLNLRKRAEDLKSRLEL